MVSGNSFPSTDGTYKIVDDGIVKAGEIKISVSTAKDQYSSIATDEVKATVTVKDAKVTEN